MPQGTLGLCAIEPPASAQASMGHEAQALQLTPWSRPRAGTRSRPRSWSSSPRAHGDGGRIGDREPARSERLARSRRRNRRAIARARRRPGIDPRAIERGHASTPSVPTEVERRPSRGGRGVWSPRSGAPAGSAGRSSSDEATTSQRIAPGARGSGARTLLRLEVAPKNPHVSAEPRASHRPGTARGRADPDERAVTIRPRRARYRSTRERPPGRPGS